MIRDSAIRQPITVSDRRLAERAARGRVVVIDDDADILVALHALLEFEGYVCETYASAVAFLQTWSEDLRRFPGPCCLVCDVRLPELDGLELQRRLAASDDLPILLMSGASGAPEAASAFRAGALDFLVKPVRAEVLLDAVTKALAVSAQRQRQQARRRELTTRFNSLTERERAIAQLVARGQRNLEMAQALGIALRTVKRHRQQVMEKLAVATLADLVRVIDEMRSTVPNRPPDHR